MPQLRSLLRATLSGAAELDAYEMDLKRAGRGTRRLVLTAHHLAYGDAAQTRLLLAVTDVTDARLAERLKDDLLREKAILYQELQHRIANSLQIIASVLMQSARRVPSARDAQPSLRCPQPGDVGRGAATAAGRLQRGRGRSCAPTSPSSARASAPR